MLSHAHAELQGAEFVVFADSSRRYVDCSEGVFHLLGYTRDEFLQMTIDDVSYSGSEVSTLFAQYLRSGNMEGDYVLQRKDRTPVLVHYRAFVFSDGCKAAVWERTLDWREPYFAALLEVDPGKLKQRVEIALAAIHQARQIKGRSQPASEQQVISDAVLTLNSLLRQRS
jgi:hypothetical protein